MVLALLIDMRIKVLTDTNCDIFESISAFRAQLAENRDSALRIWPYIQRNPGNTYLDTASRVFMLLSQTRNGQPSKIWRRLARGADFVPECAREWEHKHNELLRIDDYKRAPADLVF